MNKLRQQLFRSSRNDDDGFTLIEVVVAMLVFTMVSVGVLYTMMTVLSITRESRNRQVAANLAAQEIDLARDINDIFKVGLTQKDIVLNDNTFHVKRTGTWVYSSGQAAACGAGVGALRYKQVSVEVRWDGMRGSEQPVRSETLVNPNERINDPDLGTLIVSVTNVSNTGVPNVPVTATPTAGGTVLTGTTDSEGCLFFLGLTEGGFDVVISSPPAGGFVNHEDLPTPKVTANVVKGSSVSAKFSYAKAGTVHATYLSAGTLIPINMSTTMLSTRPPSVKDTAAGTNPRDFTVYPFIDGSSLVAGNAKLCAAADPGLWTASGVLADGDRPDPTEAQSASTVAATVPMIPIAVSNMATSGTGRFLVAVSQSVTSNGQPACATQQILRFAQTSSSTVNIALPYGTWVLYKGSSNNYVYTTGTKITSNVSVGAGGAFSGSTGFITLDPRGPA